MSDTSSARPADAAAKTVCDQLLAFGRPPWDYSAVTDDRSTVDVSRCPRPVPGGCVKPERHYACDRQAANTLAQYASPDERGKVTAWLRALDDMALDEDELSERSMYLTCLLMLLESGQLVPPFTRQPPPCRPLRTLRDVIDKHLYRAVQIECRKRRAYEPSRYAQPDRAVVQRPSDFFDNMPAPSDGVFCYGAAFSTM